MTTRVTQFFAERHEVNSFLVEIQEQEHGFLYVARGEFLEPLNAQPDAETQRVFIGKKSGLAIQGGADAPGKWGLVLLDLPFSQEGVLTMTVLSSRTDWSEDGMRRQLATAGQLHKKIESFLKRYLEFPIWARNRKNGKWEKYGSVGYTKGATGFTQKGGILKQKGVANVEFLLAPPVT